MEQHGNANNDGVTSSQTSEPQHGYADNDRSTEWAQASNKQGSRQQ